MSFTSNTILVALELSNSLWLVGTRMPGVRKSHMHRVNAGDTAALLSLLSGLQSRQRAPGIPAAIAVCFEAGRDGFWLHRLLTAHDIPTYVVEPTSILVNRRARRAKTDRLDAEGLLRVLAAYLAGDSRICSMVHVPTPDEEDGKRVHREREYLVQERTRIENRISALLVTQGIRSRPSLRRWERDMADLETGDGRKLPRHLAAEVNRLRRRLVLVRDHQHTLVLHDEFGISLTETSVGRELKKLGYVKLTARPCHHAQNEYAMEAFKKGASPPNWGRSKPPFRAAHP